MSHDISHDTEDPVNLDLRNTKVSLPFIGLVTMFAAAIALAGEYFVHRTNQDARLLKLEERLQENRAELIASRQLSDRMTRLEVSLEALRQRSDLMISILQGKENG